MEIIDLVSEIFVQLYVSFLDFYHSWSFSLLKFLLGIYAVVLLVDIVLLVIQRGISGDLADTRYGMNIPVELIKKGPKKRLAAKWAKIKSKLNSTNEKQYKIAIIEADSLIDDLVFRMGYKDGKTFGERLENIPDGQIEDLSDIKEAHAISNQVVLDENFRLDKETARKALSGFEKFLINHEVIEES